MLVQAQLAQVKRFTIAEYNQLGELGFFAPGDRLELIRGEVITMAAKGTRHVVCCRNLIEALSTLLSGIAKLQCQDPIVLDSGSQPEPDFAIARLRPDNYLSGHPTPADILLVIEIADSSLNYDRTIKIPLYAEAAIAHYWIFNLLDSQLEAYSHPYTKSNGGFDYAHRQVYLPQDLVQLPSLPDLCLNLAQIIPLDPPHYP